MKGFHRYDMIL